MLFEFKPIDEEMEKALIECGGKKQDNGNYQITVSKEDVLLFVTKLLAIPFDTKKFVYEQEKEAVYYYDDNSKCFIARIV